MSTNDLSHLDHHGPGEELANSILHGIGVGLAVAALAILVSRAARIGDPWRVVSFCIYGATLILLFLSSTLYHAFRHPLVKRVFRIFDHAAIYLLIAGTYTPFLLVTLRGAFGWWLFGVIWALALLGVVQASLALDKLKFFSLIAYAGMGWLIVIAYKPLLAALAAGGMFWIILGGVCYTLGIVFYVVKRIPFNHAIWHLFVIGGAASHFFAMLFYVLPR
jgi:hemolysin III